MNPLHQQIRELRSKGTQGEWGVVDYLPFSVEDKEHLFDCTAWGELYARNSSDAQLITFLVNNADTIADKLEELEKKVEAYEAFVEEVRKVYGDMGITACSCGELSRETDAFDYLEAALTTLNNSLKDV